MILHVDMDAFYAAIEVLDHPEWKGKPVVVGSPPDRRGVVATCSYEARRYGIHSAMPSRTAGRLCPHAIFVPPRMSRYEAISAKIMTLFESFTPLVEPLSLDEAFLDVSGALHLWGGDAVLLAKELKRRIREEVGLTASVGLACNKFLAKVASDLEKPDGLTVVPETEEGIRAFLAPLPVGKLWGIGKVSGARLEKAGIRVIGQLQEMDGPALERLFGQSGARHMADLVRGRDDRPVVTQWEEKSISHEHTFDVDESNPECIRQCLLELTEEVGGRLRSVGKAAGVAQIKIRFGDFTTVTRQRSFPAAVDSDRELIAVAFALYDRERVSRPVRLIGFGVTHLMKPESTAPVQQDLFERERVNVDDGRNKKLDKAVDTLRQVYGSSAITRGKWTGG